MIRRTMLPLIALALLSTSGYAQEPPPPILQTGALNAPTAVLTQGDQWSNLIPVLSTADVDLFIEDPSADAWLARNAQAFLDRGQFILTLVSFYKSPHPCREDQIRAGFSDATHMLACDADRYAVRTISVDAPQNSVTLLFSALVSTNGAVDASTIHRETRTRGFAQLGPNPQKAISEATKLVGAQVHTYAIRNHLTP